MLLLTSNKGKVPSNRVLYKTNYHTCLPEVVILSVYSLIDLSIHSNNVHLVILLGEVHVCWFGHPIMQSIRALKTALQNVPDIYVEEVCM